MSNIIDKIRLSGTDYTLSATSSGVSVIEVTQAQYDALPSSAKTDTSKMYVITDAEAGDLTNYYTKTETNTLLGDKQATLVSGTNIKTINNESILGSGNIDIQGGGGKTIIGGRGISVATGETADTVSFNLPISAGTGNYSIQEGQNTLASGNFGSHSEGNITKASGNASHAEGNATSATSYGSHSEGVSTLSSGMYGSHAEGQGTIASGQYSHAEGNATSATSYGSHAEGNYTIASGQYSHAEGYQTSALTKYSHAEGQGTIANNQSEHTSGQFNVSSKGSSTFGDSGNTLFSVGNGVIDYELEQIVRHNAFEIRQNGDIYLNNGTSDIKLQDYLQIKVVKLTQSAYDALSPNYDSNTLYVING